ncbi:transferase [Streptomyces sp. RKAG293]|uniref:transferase n=1 Tax=Streptomyces sp. RKAG293 TaxID=2893403 RepID=UPI00203325B8|nr:transferase [Streptomyces sp. RKAG293]MCM2424163.1 transferase [Streptomyces sp. RKAG293]
MGGYVAGPTDPAFAATPYRDLEAYDLAEFLTSWEELHAKALASMRQRIHPTAFIHPQAIVGDDVIIGPNVRIHEFSTVRKGSILCAGVSVGYGCEVTQAYIGDRTILGHRIALGRTIVGADAHLSANVTVAAISMWSPHMHTPQREIFFRTPDGLYRCQTPRFGALIGDGVQTGSNISLGPGIAIGRNCRIAGGVTLAGRAIPASHVITAPHTADTHLHPRRR